MSFVALTVVGQNSGGAVQFPELTPDVRGVGMGNTGVASSANAFSLWRNAAKSVFADSKMEVGYSFTPWLRELMSGSDMHVVGGYYNIDNKQGIMAGFRWFKHTEIELGEKVFTPKDWSVDVGYTRKLTQELSFTDTLYSSLTMAIWLGWITVFPVKPHNLSSLISCLKPVSQPSPL